MGDKHRNYRYNHGNINSTNADVCSRDVHEIPIPGGISDLLSGIIMKVSGSDWKYETAFDEEVMYETTFRFYKTRLSKINTSLFAKSIDAGTLNGEASIRDLRIKTDATESNSVKPKSKLIYVSTSATTDEVTLKSTKTERLEQIVRSMINGKRRSSSVHPAKPQKQLKPNIREDTIRTQQGSVLSFSHLDQKVSESGLDILILQERSSLEFATDVQCHDGEHSFMSSAETSVAQNSSNSPVEVLSSEDQSGKNLSEYRSEVGSSKVALENIPFDVQNDEFASHVQDQECRLQFDICTSDTDEIDIIQRESRQSESRSEKRCLESHHLCEEHITNGRTEIWPTTQHFSDFASREHFSGSLIEERLSCVPIEKGLPNSLADNLHPDALNSKKSPVDFPADRQDICTKGCCFTDYTSKPVLYVPTKVCLSDCSNEEYVSSNSTEEYLSHAPTAEHGSGSHSEECLSDFPADLTKEYLSCPSPTEGLSRSKKNFPEATTKEQRPHSPAGELILNNAGYQNISESRTKSSDPEFAVKGGTQTESLEDKILGKETVTSEADIPQDLSQSLVQIREAESQERSTKVQSEVPKANALSSGSEVQECQLEISNVQNEEYIAEDQTKGGISELEFRKFPTEFPNEMIKTGQSSEVQDKGSLSEVTRETSKSQADQSTEDQAKVSCLEFPCDFSKSQDAHAKESLLKVSRETPIPQATQSSEALPKESLSETPRGISIFQAAQSSEDQAIESLLNVSCETSVCQAIQSSEAQTKESLLENPCETSISQSVQSSEAQAKESLLETPCEISKSHAAQSSEAQAEESILKGPSETSTSQAIQFSEAQAKESLSETPCETSISETGKSSERQANASLLETSGETSISQAPRSSEAHAKESLLKVPCDTSISEAGKICDSPAKETFSQVPRGTSTSQARNNATKARTGSTERFPDDTENESYSEKTEMCSKITSTSKGDLAREPASEGHWRRPVLNKDGAEMTERNHSAEDQVNVSSVVSTSHELTTPISPEEDARNLPHKPLLDETITSFHQTVSSKDSIDPGNDSDEEDPPGNLWKVQHSGTEALAYCAGDKICELKPFVYVLREDVIMSYCSYCFNSLDTPTKTKCIVCSCAFYCNHDCQGRHLESHVRECSWLSRVRGPALPDTFTRITALVISKLNDPPSQQMRYNFRDKTYCFQDLPPSDMIPEDLLDPTTRMYLDEDYNKYRIYVNDSSLPFNEFRMMCYKVYRNSMPIIEDPFKQLGCGVYFGLAGVHVSCYPNANVSFTGATASIVAACDIDFAESDKITIRHTFYMGPRDYRQAEVQKILWKLCNCKLCQSDEFEATITEMIGGEESSAVMNSIYGPLKHVEKIINICGEEELKIAMYYLKMLDGVAGTYHYSRLNIQGIFATCLFTLGRYEEAIRAYKYLLRIYRYVYGPSNCYTMDTLLIIYRAYQQICRPDKARKYCAKALQVAYYTYGSEHRIFKGVRYDLISHERRNWT